MSKRLVGHVVERLAPLEPVLIGRCACPPTSRPLIGMGQRRIVSNVHCGSVTGSASSFTQQSTRYMSRDAEIVEKPTPARR